MTAPLTPRAELRRGWRVLLAGSVGVGFGLNLNQYVGSLFVKELQGAFGWSRGEIAQAQGALTLSIILAPFLGKLIDSWGVRPTALVSMVLLALVYVGLSQMDGSITWYYALFAAQIILGTGTGAIAYTRAISTWFVEARGLALGVTLMGVSVTGILAPPLLAELIKDLGWRAGYLGLAGLLVLIAMPIVYWGLFERADYLKRRGEADDEAQARRDAKVGYGVREALRQPRFYILTACMLVMSVGLVGVISQLGPILTDKGLAPATAALLISTLAFAVLVGRLVVGLLFDRFWAPLPAAIALAVPAIGAWMLMGPTTDLLILVPAVALIGFAQGAEVDVAAFFIARYFGLKAYASIYALVGIGFGVGIAGGAILSGKLFDRFGNYDALLTVAAAAFVLSGLIILAMGRYPTFATDE